MPLHRLALGDPQDTNIYISDKTGDVVMKTTGSSRRWAYAGAVLALAVLHAAAPARSTVDAG